MVIPSYVLLTGASSYAGFASVDRMMSGQQGAATSSAAAIQSKSAGVPATLTATQFYVVPIEIAALQTDGTLIHAVRAG